MAVNRVGREAADCSGILVPKKVIVDVLPQLCWVTVVRMPTSLESDGVSKLRRFRATGRQRPLETPLLGFPKCGASGQVPEGCKQLAPSR